MNNKEKITNIIDIIKNSSLFLLILLTNILVITNLLFIIKINITKFHLPIIFIISIIIYCLFKKKTNVKRNVLSLLLGLLIFTTAIFISGRCYDITSDGNTYHKLAVGALKNGWNPNYESVTNFNINKGNPFNVNKDNINTKWVNHYAKGTETFGAVIYAFTNNIESGKAYTIIFMYIVFGIFLAFFNKKKINILISLLLSFIIVANPITIVQSTNYYVDGVLMLSLFLIFYSCYKLSIGEKNKEIFLILGSSILWCINAKFTGLAYAGLFCLAFYIYWLIKAFKKGKKYFWKEFKIYTLFYIVTVIISILVVGFGSYAKNTLDYGHPLYPLKGKGHVENMVVKEQPKSFKNKNNAEIFLTSLFAKGVNVSPSYSSENIQPELKIPLTFTKEELNNYSISDIRMAGFGPLFSGAFVISFVLFILTIIDFIKNKKWDLFVTFSIIFGISMLLILCLDGSYWARYIPYLYFIPIMAITYGLLNKKLKKYLSLIVLIILFFNSILVLNSFLKNYCLNNRYITKNIKYFKETYNKNDLINIKLNNNNTQGVQYNLDDIGFRYKIVNDDKLTRDIYFFSVENK